MLHTYVQKFDVTGTVVKFLRTKQRQKHKMEITRDPANGCKIHHALVLFVKQATPSPNDCPSAGQINARGQIKSFCSPGGILRCSPLLLSMHPSQD